MADKSIQKSDWKEAFVNSGLMFLYMMVFSVLGFVFMFSQGISDWLQLLIGLCFSVPTIMLYFYQGTQEGKREFKKLNGNRLESAKKTGAIVPNVFKGLLYVLPYLSLTLFVSGVAWISDSQTLKFIVLVVFMPAAILGQSFGIITFPHQETLNPGTVDEVTAIVGTTSGSMCFTVVCVFAVLSALVFWIAYVREINKSKEQFVSFVTEITINDKFRNQ